MTSNLSPRPAQINADFTTPVVVISSDKPATGINETGSSSKISRVLESVGSGNLARQTILTTLSPGSTLSTTEKHGGLEILVLDGAISDSFSEYPAEFYLRLPPSYPANITSESGCILFIKYNQLMPGDDGLRTIDTRDPEKWLPGPVEGTEIHPLHVYSTESIMLLRWTENIQFRPRLDPQGEELLIIKGLLHNRDIIYPPYSWLRNPVEDWRRWRGEPGTLVYYKSGHFPPR